MKRLCVLWLMAAPAGCVYEVQTLILCAANGGLGPCGPDERCESHDGAEVCACGLSFATGAPACRADQICHPDSFCNTPPVARIGDGSTAVDIASGVTVTFDGSGSYDLDANDVLNFNWTVNGQAIDGVPFGDKRAVWLEPLALSQGAVVALTVRDVLQDENTASVVVNLVNVGAHVSNQTPCADVSGTADGGSPGKPWCTLSLGIEAARTYHIAEVRVAGGPYQEDVSVPPLVTIAGGYQRSNWQQISIKSELQVLDDDGVIIEPHAMGAALVNMRVSRLAMCTAPCALITARGASLTLAGCDIDNSANSGGFPSRAVDVSGPAIVNITRDSAGAITRIQMAANSSQNYGIFLDGRSGRLSGHLDSAEILLNTDVVGTDREMAGVRLLATEGVTLTTPNVSMNNSQAGNDRVFGILDGAGRNFTQGPCIAISCGGSTNLSILPGYVNVQSSGRIAAGVALFGSKAPLISTSVPSVALRANSSETSFGLWTIETTGLTVRGAVGSYLTLTGATTAAAAAQRPSLGAGFLDGVPVFNFGGTPWLSYEGGSTGLTLDRVSAQGGALGLSTPNAVAGMILAGTRDAILRDIRLERLAAPTAPEISVGLWTLGSENVSVDQMVLPGGDCPALRLSAGVVDGAYLPMFGLSLVGSRGLSITNSSLDSALTSVNGTPEPFRACVLLAGSRETRVGEIGMGNLIRCPTRGQGALHQVFALGTQDVSISANTFGRANEVRTSTAPMGTLHVGIQEGLGAAGLESYGLVIDANLLYAPVEPWYEQYVGIRIDHTGAPVANDDDLVEVTNNVVFGTAAQTSLALWIENAPGVVFNNTLHGGDCGVNAAGGPCTPPWVTAGLNVANGAGRKIDLANNLIMGGAGTPNSYALIDRSASLDGTANVTANTRLSVGLFIRNALANDGNTISAYSYLHVGGDGAMPPVGGYDYDASTIDALLAALKAADPAQDSLWVDSPALCPDRYHLQPGPGPLVNGGSPTYRAATDIDGESRVGEPMPDIGADEVLSRAGCP